MKKHAIPPFTFALLLVFVLFSSCSNGFYIPAEINPPVVSQKNEVAVSSAIGLRQSGLGNSFAVQAAYSPINHIALWANYLHVGSSNTTKIGGLSNPYYFRSAEMAVGYYFKKSLGFAALRDKEHMKSRHHHYLIADAYAGYGLSDVFKSYPNAEARFDAQRYFLQGGVHYSGARRVELSYSLRLVLLDFTKGLVSGKISDPTINEIMQVEQNPFTFFQSSVRFAFGGKTVKYYFSRNWMSPPFKDKTFDYVSASFHIGLILNVNQLFSVKKE